MKALPIAYCTARSIARRTRQACHRWRLSCATRTWRPVARLKKMPRTNGFGNRMPARSRSALARKNSRRSACVAEKLANVSASGGAARGRIFRGAFILDHHLGGGSSKPMNNRPTHPGLAGRRRCFPRPRARFAGSCMARRYNRFPVVRWSKHSATLQPPPSGRRVPCSSDNPATSASASRSAASSSSCSSVMSAHTSAAIAAYRRVRARDLQDFGDWVTLRIRFAPRCFTVLVPAQEQRW